jgi:nucleotide-binding universal stress UspA family protein
MKNIIKLHKILIAVDDSSYSDKAAAYGFALAKKLSAEIALVHVDEIPVGVPYSGDPMLNEPAIIIPEIMSIQEEASTHLMTRLTKTAGKDTKLHTFKKIGNPKEEILSTAEEWHADMIILGTHGRTGLDHFLSGSLAESIVRKATCPVLIIPNK